MASWEDDRRIHGLFSHTWLWLLTCLSVRTAQQRAVREYSPFIDLSASRPLPYRAATVSSSLQSRKVWPACRASSRSPLYRLRDPRSQGRGTFYNRKIP